MTVLAIQQIRKMRGGAQSHLMLGDDGHAWIVKFQNNPQHLRVLPNELLGTRLGALMGLTMPQCDVVEVTAWLIEQTAELEMDYGHRRERCQSGLHFGSQLVGGLMPGHVADYLPEEQLMEVRNLREFAGALVLDKWTCNANGRQALFHRGWSPRKSNPGAGNGATARRSSTRGSVSIPGSGALLMRRCAASTRATGCTAR